ncbi:TTLL9 polyglutamylase, partial [Polypterus senegalus]
MDEHVRICHFRNHYELTRKNLMVKNLKRYRKLLEREAGRMEAAKFDFYPSTFELPFEYHLFVEEFKRNPGSTWIMKPVARSQGKGIFLFRKLKDIMDWKKDGNRFEDQKDEIQVESYVAQRYIENPYLIGGRKFDLRVYVLVTSYTPLKAWLYRDGFARFSNTRFSLSSIDDNCILEFIVALAHYKLILILNVHLTNVAIQKTAPDYDPEKGCKWQMQQLRRYLIAKHGVDIIEMLFRDMDAIFVRSLQSVQKVIINDKHCFELYGYDILLDEQLKPWLIEVNASPSLTASSLEDYDLKCRLLEDTLHVVDMEGRLTGKEKQVGGFDLMWNDGPVYTDDSDYRTNTHLGVSGFSDSEWDFYWCDVGWLRDNFDHMYLEEHVRISHFRNHYQLTRKNLMVKNLKRYRKLLERETGRLEAEKCDFFPCTFELPFEYHLFVEEFKKNPGRTWIMKPVGRSQGEGIFLFRKLKDIMDWKKEGSRFDEQKDETQVERYVAQRYIENPYLIGDAHLTNVAIQKTAQDYDPEKGCKWQIQQLRRYLGAKHGMEAVETVFKDMDAIIVRSLQSVQKVIINDKHCFELYGYDILLDENLKPLTGKEKQVGGFDLIWNNGPVYKDISSLVPLGYSSFLANTHLAKNCNTVCWSTMTVVAFWLRVVTHTRLLSVPKTDLRYSAKNNRSSLASPEKM